MKIMSKFMYSSYVGICIHNYDIVIFVKNDNLKLHIIRAMHGTREY